MKYLKLKVLKELGIRLLILLIFQDLIDTHSQSKINAFDSLPVQSNQTRF